MNKKIILLALASLSLTVSASERKRPAPEDFVQQRQLPAPFQEPKEEQVSLADLNISEDLFESEDDLPEDLRELPSLRNSNALRIFFKYAKKEDPKSVARCVDLFRKNKLDVNGFYLDHRGYKALPLYGTSCNQPLTRALLLMKADPYKKFQLGSHDDDGVGIEWITPLSVACLYSQMDEVVKFYALKRYNFNFLDHEKLTPLHYLIVSEKIETFIYVLASGAIDISFHRKLAQDHRDNSDFVLEQWIDEFSLLDVENSLYKKLIIVLEKQQKGTFKEEDKVTYKQAYEVLEKARAVFLQDVIKEKAGKIQHPIKVLRNCKRGIKK